MDCSKLDKRTKAYKECIKAKDSSVPELTKAFDDFLSERGFVDEPEKIGLGDIVEKVTEATGIKKAVEKVSKKLGVDCGCEKRKEMLNQIKFKANTKHKPLRCFTPDRLKDYQNYIEIRVPKTWQPYQVDYLLELYAYIFAIQYNRRSFNCNNCNGKTLQAIQDNLDKVYNEQI